MFSLCDQEGERLLVLETSSEKTTLVAASIPGIAFELFRTHGPASMEASELIVDEEIKRFIIQSHGVYTTTSQILDTIHACLLKNESSHYWQCVQVAAQR
jgi:hypothetical protein